MTQSRPFQVSFVKQMSKVIWQKATLQSLLFLMAENAFSWSWTPSNNGSMDPHGSAPQMASWSVQPVLHISSVCPTNKHTHRHTDHATCDICNNRLHLMHCMQAIWPTNLIMLSQFQSKRQQWLSNNTQLIQNATATTWTQQLPPRTFAWTVSSELLGFWFYFFLMFSFLGHVLD